MQRGGKGDERRKGRMEGKEDESPPNNEFLAICMLFIRLLLL